jgi:uncharacterized protein (DUF4415 family)
MVFKYAPQDPALAAFVKPAVQPAPPPASAARSPEPPKPQPPAPATSPPPAITGKTLVSLRIDTDLLAAFKANGKGWQTRINATLRTARCRKIAQRRFSHADHPHRGGNRHRTCTENDFRPPRANHRVSAAEQSHGVPTRGPHSFER